MSQPLAPKQKWLSVIAAIAGMTAVSSGIGISLPLLAINLEYMGLSSKLIGLNSAMPGFAWIMITPFVPNLLKRFGTLQFLYFCLAVASACMVIFMTIKDPWLWFPVRFFFGGALGVMFLVCEYWINASIEDHERGRFLGLYAAIISLGFASGPFILTLFGPENPITFLSAVLMFVIAGICIFPARNVVPQVTEKPKISVLSYFWVAPTIMGAALICAILESGVFSFMPLYALRMGFGVSIAALTVTCVGIGNALFQLPLGFAAERIDNRLILLLMAITGLIVALLIPHSTGYLPFYLLLMTMLGGIVFGFYTIGLIELGTRFKGADLAAGNGAFGMAYSGGAMIGPLVTGSAMDVWDPQGLIVVIVAIFLIYGLIVFWRWRIHIRKPFRAPESTDRS